MNEARNKVPIKVLSWKWVWTRVLYERYGDKM